MTKRILIVEDDHAMARLLSDNLKYEGFLVETCDSGRKTLAAVKALKIAYWFWPPCVSR